jgi:hypothetical protein
MTTSRSTEYLAGLVREMCKLPRETEWVEFKEDNAEPNSIGAYVSALVARWQRRNGAVWCGCNWTHGPWRRP